MTPAPATRSPVRRSHRRWRADLAAALLDLLGDTRWVGRIAAVATPGLRLQLVRTVREEVLKH